MENKKIIFEVEEAKPSTLTETGFFTNRSEAPATDVFFRVNKEIPTINVGLNKPQVGHTIEYSPGYGSQSVRYFPETYLLNDGRYKLVLKKNQDFHRAIKGLASFAQFDDCRPTNTTGIAFTEKECRSKDLNFKIKYTSKKLEKTLKEI